ncbi:MAG: hypothetical protein MHM6MM_009049 [Cercozoa sp. M6MM]
MSSSGGISEVVRQQAVESVRDYELLLKLNEMTLEKTRSIGMTTKFAAERMRESEALQSNLQQRLARVADVERSLDELESVVAQLEQTSLAIEKRFRTALTK